jgi:folate-binding protein YgfZ
MSHRGVVRVTGPDRLSWLHSLTSQHLERLAPGQGAQALVLSPQGHIEHHLVVADDGEATWIVVEPGTAPALVEFLLSMRFMLRVDPADVTGEFATLNLLGPAAEAAPASVATVRGLGLHPVPIVVPRPQLVAQVTALREAGAALAGMWAHEALRIADGQPRFGLDTDHRTIPHEVGWIGPAVHMDKGCYRGQETVARVHNLGHPPRRLVLLQLDGLADALPAHGAPVTLDGSAVGFVGSAARHYELGPIALGLVKRTVPVAAQLQADGIAAAQEVIVPPDAGANVQITLRRLRSDPVGRARE